MKNQRDWMSKIESRLGITKLEDWYDIRSLDIKQKCADIIAANHGMKND